MVGCLLAVCFDCWFRLRLLTLVVALWLLLVVNRFWWFTLLLWDVQILVGLFEWFLFVCLVPCFCVPSLVYDGWALGLVFWFGLV